MAKKKQLSDFQLARREFVQKRLQETGFEGTPEQRQKFRQRFNVLASTVEGRGKLANKLRPSMEQEERKNFRRMLATEMPARRDLPTGGGKIGTGSTGVTTGKPVIGPPAPSSFTSAQIATMRQGAAKMGPQLSMVQRPPAGSFGATQKVGSYTGPSLTKTSKSKLPTINNPIARAVSKGLQAVVPGLSDVAQARKEIDKGNVVGGLGRLAAGTAATAATVASLFGFGAGPAAKPSPIRSKGPSKPPTRPTAPKPPKGGPVRPKAPKGPLPSKNRLNDQLGKQMDDHQSTLGNLKKPSKTAPKTKTPTPKQMPKKASTPKPEPKTMPKKADAPKPEPKTMPKKVEPKPAAKTATAPAAKAAPAKAPAVKKVSAKTEDMAYTLNQARIKYPKATETDIPFIQKVNEAQQIVQKQGTNWRQYSVWLQGPATTARLRALRGK